MYWKWPLPPLELFQIFIWFGPTIRPSASFSFHHLFWYFVSHQCTNSNKKPEQDNVKKSFFWWYDVVRHVSIPISHDHTSAHSFMHYYHILDYFLQNLYTFCIHRMHISWSWHLLCIFEQALRVLRAVVFKTEIWSNDDATDVHLFSQSLHTQN